MTAPIPPPPPWSSAFARPVLVALGALVVLLLLWQLQGVLMLLFGGMVIATALNALVSLVSRLTRLSYRLSMALSLVGLALVGAWASWLIGAALVEQLSAMMDRLPAAAQAVRRWIEAQPLGPRVLELWGTTANLNLSVPGLLGAAGMTLGVAGKAILMLLLGIFIAAEPEIYRKGLLAVIAPRHRPLAADTIAAARTALAQWLRGQGLSMLFVGTATGVGLMLLGVPLALSLGVIAGALGFIPFFGAIGSGLLAVLLAFSEGPQAALNVAILCIVIQQVEGHLLIPLIQRWSVQLAPVLSLLAVVIFGSIFGLLGVLLAAPLMVLVVVLVKKLYVERLPLEAAA
jgi:predicted PurR-regulated permease PerM